MHARLLVLNALAWIVNAQNSLDFYLTGCELIFFLIRFCKSPSCLWFFGRSKSYNLFVPNLN